MNNKLIYLICIALSITSCVNHGEKAELPENTEDDININNTHITNIIQRNDSAITDNTTANTFNYKTVVVEEAGHHVDNEITEIESIHGTIENSHNRYSLQYNSRDTKIRDKKPNILTVVFDNDIFTNTDYYYTNGAIIEFTTSLAKSTPLNAIFPGRKTADISLGGFSIQQNIYTPTNPDVKDIRYGDRPFAAFLTIGQFSRNTNFNKKLNISSSINFGVMGPASMGDFVQSSIHDIQPVGWENQISNNIVIDYNISIEKGLFSSPHFEFNALTEAQIGTAFDKITAGFYSRIGSFIPVYRGVDILKTDSPGKLQYWFFLSAKSNFVLYDATLQGGLFNNDNPYTIASSDIKRAVFNASAGMAVYYRSLGIELHGYYTTPEFNNAFDFKWGRVVAVYNF